MTLTFDTLTELRDKVLSSSGASFPLMLVIHPNREKDLIKLLEDHTGEKVKDIITIMGMRVVIDAKCPTDKIIIAPEFEFKI